MTEGVSYVTERFMPTGVEPPDARARAAKFVLERWRDITFDGHEEWLVKRFLPRRGLAAIYGKPGSFKSFVAQHIALCVATGEPWAGRRTCTAPVVYIAAEGAAGFRKRKMGYEKAKPSLPADLPFALISTAPNLGVDPGDLPALKAAIEKTGVIPGLIVIDTVAQTLFSADENSTGMTALIANAGTIARHFDCLVLFVHHVGLQADRRLRGHTSLAGALDAQILCERKENEDRAVLTLQKLKDDTSSVCLLARLARVVVGHDEDREEISTLSSRASKTWGRPRTRNRRAPFDLRRRAGWSWKSSSKRSTRPGKPSGLSPTARSSLRRTMTS
jgi:hypothetical protein